MIVNAKPSGILSLGRTGENQARSIRFDISHWVKDFGQGLVELVHQRSGDPYPYPVVVTQTGNEVLWNITATDTAMVGLGRCELQFYLGGVLAKSENWYTKVFDSISASDDVIPDPEVSWVTEVIRAGAVVKEQAARAEAAAEKAEAATVNAPILGDNGNWFVWDKTIGEYVDTGVYSGGITPHIGDNGNWYVGQTDTGVSATGPAGPALAVTNTAAVGQTIKVAAVDGDGKPTEWEAVNMPEQVQPDWNQNDSTAANYVKNRPFYTGDPVETVLVEESTVPFVEDNGFFIGQKLPTFEAAVGETYKVSWDGAAYECTCVVIEGAPFPVIGNLHILGLGSDTGEPFIMGIVNSTSIIIFTQDTSSSHTVSISLIGNSVVKIDAKYLPANVATKSDVEVAWSTAESAQNTAENAQNTAENAQNTAENAKTTANTAKTTAENAKTTANTAKTTAENAKTTANTAKTTAENAKTTANTAKTTAENAKTTADEAKAKVAKALTVDSTGSIRAPTVGMGGGTYQELRLTSKDAYHNSIFKLTESTGLQIWVTRDGGLGGAQVNNPATIEFIANGSNRICLKGINELIMNSSTPDSTKKFKITVDDSGTLSTTEVTW